MIKAVIVNDTSIENHFGCKLVIEQIFEKCNSHGIKIIHSIKLNENWKDEIHLEKFNEADLVIVNGEGTLHNSTTRAKLLASCAPFCRKNGIPCCLINSVYQNNDKSIAADVKYFDLIFVRESQSQKELSDSGISSEVVPDLIFGHTGLFDKAKNIKDGNFLFSDSVLDKLTIELYNVHIKFDDSHFITMRNVMDNFIVKYPEFSITKIIKSFIKNILIYIGIIKKRTILSNSDNIYLNCEQIEVLEKIYKIHNKRSEFLNIIFNSKIVITGRFHMVCLSMLAGVPFFAVPSNTHKIQALIDDVGLVDKILALKDLTPKQLRELHWSNEDHMLVNKYLNISNEKINNMFKRIASVVVVNQN